MEKNSCFDGILKAYPCGFIAREEIEKATGGVLSRKYLANLDSLGQGIQGRFRVGRKIVYPTIRVVEFLKSRVGEI